MKNGHNGNGEPTQVQVLVGLVQTEQGVQLACSIPARQAIRMLVQVLEDLREKAAQEAIASENLVQPASISLVKPIS